MDWWISATPHERLIKKHLEKYHISKFICGLSNETIKKAATLLLFMHHLERLTPDPLHINQKDHKHMFANTFL